LRWRLRRRKKSGVGEEDEECEEEDEECEEEEDGADEAQQSM
jgi:hypothetical protein